MHFLVLQQHLLNSRNKWTKIGKKNIVILHAIYESGDNAYVPTVSPVVLKLETYLKIAKIP